MSFFKRNNKAEELEELKAQLDSIERFRNNPDGRGGPSSGPMSDGAIMDRLRERIDQLEGRRENPASKSQGLRSFFSVISFGLISRPSKDPSQARIDSALNHNNYDHF